MSRDDQEQRTQTERLARLAVGILSEQPTAVRSLCALVYVARVLAAHLPRDAQQAIGLHMLREAAELDLRLH